MSLPVILDAIRAAGQAQVREAEECAQRQIQEMRANARVEAERVAEETRLEVVTPAYRERARILHRARLEALQLTGNRREALVDTALDQARGHLEGLRTDAAYPQVLQTLTQEALDELDSSLKEGGGAQLEIDPRDRELMERILSEMGLNLEVSTGLECWGGLIARSQDGRVVVINTLEARLERATPYLRRHLAGLFEGELPESQRDLAVGVAVSL